MIKQTASAIAILLIWQFLLISPVQAQRSGLSEVYYGTMPDGRTVKRFTLQNRNGMVVKVITYGAIVTDIRVPDRDSQMHNVVIGSDTLEHYLRRFPAAAVIGRFANRIGNARFELDGQVHELTPNMPNGHHIHGGQNGFAKQLWTPELMQANDSTVNLKLSYYSEDGEEGYPGNLKASVTYSLNDQNELSLHYEATTDQATILNLTNHAYFDLSGTGDIAGHRVHLNADHYTPTDMDQIPTGTIAPVADTPLDFRAPTLIGARMQEVTGARPGVYDHNFIINNGGTGLVRTAEVYYAPNGRVLEVSTTLPGVQFFTGNPVGFCLETQQFPDAINHPNFPSPVLRPDEPFSSRTVFAFSVR